TEDVCKYRQELTSTGDVITTVGSNENAIGYASLAAVNDDVKALSVGGVTPTEETVKDGSYAVQRPFVLVTKSDKKLSDTAQKFFDYALSDDAKSVIYDAGVVPAKD
ncbi:MAG: substrate-binding domain-containing protein, partial [Ruminococcus sp.]